jgi:hypothetical protein
MKLKQSRGNHSFIGDDEIEALQMHGMMQKRLNPNTE